MSKLLLHFGMCLFLGEKVYANDSSVNVSANSSWLNSTNDFLTLGLLVVGILSLIVLLFYTYYTYQMSKTMMNSYLLDKRPYLAFENLEVMRIPNTITGIEDVRIGIILKNIGRVPLDYTVSTINVEVNGRTANSPKFENNGGSIFPGMTSVFRYPVIKEIGPNAVACNGIVEFDISYKTEILGKVYRTYRKVKYYDTSPTSFEYVDVDYICE